MKVFCKNCKWVYHGGGHDFGGGGYYCYCPQFETEKICGDYTQGFRKKTYAASPEANNPNGECQYYKRKWWKFWVNK